jgi:hypothetical protein
MFCFDSIYTVSHRPLRRAENVAGKGKSAYRILVRSPMKTECKNHYKNLIYMWKNNINMDLREQYDRDMGWITSGEG